MRPRIFPSLLRGHEKTANPHIDAGNVFFLHFCRNALPEKIA